MENIFKFVKLFYKQVFATHNYKPFLYESLTLWHDYNVTSKLISYKFEKFLLNCLPKDKLTQQILKPICNEKNPKDFNLHWEKVRKGKFEKVSSKR